MVNFKKTSIVAGLLCVTAASQASITWFNSLGGWNGAAGATSFTEDFSGFTSDAIFQTNPVAINGGSLIEEGPDSWLNYVDASAANVVMATDFGLIAVRMTFSTALSAFGFETWEAASGEMAMVEVYNGAVLLGSYNLSNDDGAFAGFVLDGGDTATSIVWRSRTDVSVGGLAERFVMDNLVGVNAMNPVPEPFTMALLGGAALAGYRRVRARKLG